MVIRINEIFNSVQGEGSLMGVWSQFIRVSGCNKQCDWCDTTYALQPQDSDTVIDELDLSELLLPVPNIVFTGGEPLLYGPQIVRGLLAAPEDMLKETIISFETNGDLLSGSNPGSLAKLQRRVKSLHIAVSPKLVGKVEDDVACVTKVITQATKLGTGLDVKLMCYGENISQVLTQVLPEVCSNFRSLGRELNLWVYPIRPREYGALLASSLSTTFAQSYNQTMQNLDPVSLFGKHQVRLGIQSHRFYGLK